MMSHRNKTSQYKRLFHLSDAKTFWKMYTLIQFSRKSYLCCGRYLLVSRWTWSSNRKPYGWCPSSRKSWIRHWFETKFCANKTDMCALRPCSFSDHFERQNAVAELSQWNCLATLNIGRTCCRFVGGNCQECSSCVPWWKQRQSSCRSSWVALYSASRCVKVMELSWYCDIPVFWTAIGTSFLI